MFFKYFNSVASISTAVKSWGNGSQPLISTTEGPIESGSIKLCLTVVFYSQILQYLACRPVPYCPVVDFKIKSSFYTSEEVKEKIRKTRLIEDRGHGIWKPDIKNFVAGYSSDHQHRLPGRVKSLSPKSVNLLAPVNSSRTWAHQLECQRIPAKLRRLHHGSTHSFQYDATRRLSGCRTTEKKLCRNAASSLQTTKPILGSALW